MAIFQREWVNSPRESAFKMLDFFPPTRSSGIIQLIKKLKIFTKLSLVWYKDTEVECQKRIKSFLSFTGI